MRVGRSRPTWPGERPLPSVRAVAGSLAVASTIGGRAADALDGLAASLRERIGAIAEARALSAQSRMSAVIVGVAPLGYLLFSAALDPSSVDALVTTHVGRLPRGRDRVRGPRRAVDAPDPQGW
jgi:tight adherence protein B